MRAGVFLCECGGNISGVVDLEPLAEHVRSLDGVVEVNINQFMCGTEGRALIEKAVEERGLDHFVIASCSPRCELTAVVEPMFCACIVLMPSQTVVRRELNSSLRTRSARASLARATSPRRSLLTRCNSVRNSDTLVVRLL